MSIGLLDELRFPNPNSPYSLAPVAYTLPSSDNNNEWLFPHDTYTIFSVISYIFLGNNSLLFYPNPN